MPSLPSFIPANPPEVHCRLVGRIRWTMQHTFLFQPKGVTDKHSSFWIPRNVCRDGASITTQDQEIEVQLWWVLKHNLEGRSWWKDQKADCPTSRNIDRRMVR